MKDLMIVKRVEAVLSGRPKGNKHRVKLPIIRSKRPGSLDLTNENIYKIIPFP